MTGGVSFKFYNRHSNYSGYMQATTIQVDTNVRDMLKSFGRKGETYNDIIVKLIDRARYVEFMNECYDILDNEENWVSLDELE